MNFEVRNLSRDDCRELGELVALRDGELPELISKKFEEELLASETKEDRMIFVGLVGGRVTGYARVEFFSPETGKKLYGLGSELPAGWYLRGIYVAREARQLGLGTLLTKARLEWLRDRTSKAWCFLSTENDISYKFHLKIGFDVERKGLPYGWPATLPTGALMSYTFRREFLCL